MHTIQTLTVKPRPYNSKLVGAKNYKKTIEFVIFQNVVVLNGISPAHTRMFMDLKMDYYTSQGVTIGWKERKGGEFTE